MAATNGIPESVAMALRYSPATAQQVRRSQYLEDALQEMAANGGKNISSGWDLAARLAAVALYKRGSNRAYDATVSALKDDQARRIAKAMAGLPSDAAPQTPPALTPPAARRRAAVGHRRQDPRWSRARTSALTGCGRHPGGAGHNRQFN